MLELVFIMPVCLRRVLACAGMGMGDGGLLQRVDTALTCKDVPVTPHSPPLYIGFFLDDRKDKMNIPLPLGNTDTPRLYFPRTLMKCHFHAYGGVFHAPVEEESPASSGTDLFAEVLEIL